MNLLEGRLGRLSGLKWLMFPMAPVTNCHTPGGLKQLSFILLQL